jgi:hypothetical protein
MGTTHALVVGLCDSYIDRFCHLSLYVSYMNFERTCEYMQVQERKSVFVVVQIFTLTPARPIQVTVGCTGRQMTHVSTRMLWLQNLVLT